jgi:hypothetical protein
LSVNNTENDNNGFCLNVGCGLIAPFGWTNIDSSFTLKLARTPIIGNSIIRIISGPDWPSSALCGDIVKGLKIPFESCDLIFASHVLEHISLSDFHIAMNNIYSYLKSGGIFRAIVPDLNYYIKKYNSQISDRSASSKASFEFMEKMNIGYAQSRRNIFFRLLEAVKNSRHQWMWDTPSLFSAFVDHGFKGVRLCEYGDWSDVRFNLVDNKESYADSICIEGHKE